MIFLLLLQLWSFTASAETLAQVGDVKISSEDFKRRYMMSLQSPNPVSPEKFLEQWIRLEAGAQEAAKLKLSDDPEVKERVKQVLYTRLVEKNLQPQVEKISVTDSQMASYYKANPEIRLAHILVEAKANGREIDRELGRKKALEILNDVKKSKKSWDDLVKEFSDDQATSNYGGDIGFQSRVTLLPAIYDTALKMKQGEIKGVIETRFGFHILKRLEQRSYDLADKQQIRSAVIEQKQDKLFDEYFGKLKRGYKIEVDQKVLKSLTE